MTKTVHGIVRGNTIELSEGLGIAEGQEVQVHVSLLEPAKEKWGEGLQRSAGALADDWTDEDDRILEEIYQERKRDTRREVPE